MKERKEHMPFWYGSENQGERYAAIGFLIALAAYIGVYFKSFWYPFIFDDVPTIVTNFLVNHGTPSKIFAAHSRWVSVLINNLTVRYGGMNPFYFRMVNLVMHGSLGILTFFLFRWLLSELKHQKWVYAHKSVLAGFAATFFLLHPVQTQTAVYISQMRLEGLVLLCTLGLLATLYKFHHAASSVASYAWYALALVLCFIAAGTKEIMIVIPFLVAITDYTFFSKGNFKKWFHHMLWYLPLWAVLYGTFMFFSCPFSLKQILTLNITLDNNRGNVLTGNFEKKIESLHFLSGQFRIMMHYIRIFFLPTGLTFDYGWTLPASWLEFSVWGNLLALLSLAGYLFYRWTKQKADLIVWAGIWFFIGMLPRTSVIPTAELVCDYKTYISSFAMMLILAYVTLKVLEYVVSLVQDKQKEMGFVVSGCLIALMALSSEQRNQIWSGEYPFWKDVIEKQETKSARVYNNYAAALHSEGRMEEALAMLQKSSEADPLYAEPLINLGICSMNAGHEDKAIAYFEKAVSFLHEPHQEAFANLAHLYYKKNMPEKALITVVPALQLNPFYAIAWNVLALIYAKLGFEDGVRHAYAQAQVKDGRFDLDRHLAAAYFFKDDVPNALTLLEKVLTYNNSYFYNFMAGSCYYKQERYEKAATCFEEAYKQNPGYSGCSYNLAMSYVNTGRYAQALPLFESLLSHENVLQYVWLQYAKCAYQTGKTDVGQKAIEHIIFSNLPDAIKKEATELQLAYAAPKK